MAGGSSQGKTVVLVSYDIGRIHWRKKGCFFLSFPTLSIIGMAFAQGGDQCRGEGTSGRVQHRWRERGGGEDQPQG